MFDIRHEQLSAWRALIERRFLSGLHTRVSAAVLFASGIEHGPRGEESRQIVRLVRNPNAKVAVPLWSEGLRRFDGRDARRQLVKVTRHAR
jgi:hypothetical protein